MPLRPRSHRLEDESRVAFQRALPSAWVFRPVTPDYGIDGEVELYDSDGHSTGMRFHVQLKATDQTGASARTVRLPRETYEYYRSLDAPVLLVRYLANGERLFARWVHSFDPYYEGATEASVAFRFGDEHAWSPDTPEELRTEVEAFRRFRGPATQLPIRAYVVSPEATPRGVALAEWVISIRNAAAEIGDLVEIHAGPAPAGEVTITLGETELTVSLGGVGSATAHEEGSTGPATLTRVPYDALTMLAVALDNIGYANVASQIARAVAGKSNVGVLPEVAFGLAGCFARARRINEALHVSEELLERDEETATIAAQLFTIPALHLGQHQTPDERIAYEAYLERRITSAQNSGDALAEGTAQYNLANHLRTTGRHREAIAHYRLARKRDPSYGGRDYFCREVGSSLFISGRYVLAGAFFERALELGDRGPTRGLLAEARMFAGYLRDARELFEQVLEDFPPGESGWRLKADLLRALEALVGPVHARDPEAAAALAEPNDASQGEFEGRLNEALQRDALCAVAWFNLGVLKTEQDQREQAAEAFLAAAILEPWDVEAWCNFVALSIALGLDSNRLGDALTAAYESNGPRLMSQFAEWARGQPPEVDADAILAALDAAVAALPREETGYIVRFPTGDLPDHGAIEFGRGDAASGEGL